MGAPLDVHVVCGPLCSLPGTPHTSPSRVRPGSCRPDSQRAEASVICDLGFPPPLGCGQAFRPLRLLGPHHSRRCLLGPGEPSQLGGSGGRVVGWAGSPGTGDWGLAVVGTAVPASRWSPSLRSPPSSHGRPAVAGPDSPPPKSEVSDCTGRTSGAVIPASNYRPLLITHPSSCRD